TEATERFHKDPQAQSLLASTRKLADIVPDDYAALFYPGGHGPLWDLAEDPNSINLIERYYGQDKPIGMVCLAPGALRHVKLPDGRPLVSGKHVTGFSNSEEEAAQLTGIVPFLVEDELKHHGGQYTKADDWQEHVIIDHKLVTG